MDERRVHLPIVGDEELAAARREAELLAEEIPIAVSDVRQWTFCPRVLWHRRVMPHRVSETPKMALGREAQSVLEGLEKRRTGRRYGLGAASRRFDVRVASVRLGVRGYCDAVLDVPPTEGTPRHIFPVEVKRTEGGASAHHVAQVAGYALLLEEQEGVPEGSVDRGFLVLLPVGEVVSVELGVRPRLAFLRAVSAIRAMVAAERFPEPTKFRGFCPQCEYVRFCGDVL